jgi:M6 family metalloprotease-like protein
MCAFADTAALLPRPAAYYQGLMGAAYPGVDHYFREGSNGVMSLEGSRVMGWLTLPKRRSQYSPGDDSFDLDGALRDAVALADRDVYFPSYAGIQVVFNDNPFTSYWGMGMTRTLSLDGQSKRYGVTWIRQGINQTLIAHEIGHTFGLMHSSGPYDETYDSDWDVMSHWYGKLHPVYGWVAMGTIGYHKQKMGWIPASQTYTAAPGSSRVLRIERLQMPSTGDLLVARIPINGSGTRFYSVEARRKVGYDESVPAEGIVIHQVDESRDDRVARVVDADGNGNCNDDGAAWTPGETFADGSSGAVVEVLSGDATGYSVRIALGGLMPPTRLAASASSGKVSLTWEDNTADEQGFQIERKTGASGAFALLAAVGRNASRYLDQSLQPETGYTYRVRAIRSGQASSYSNEAAVRTPPAVPGRLRVSTRRVSFGRVQGRSIRTRTLRLSNTGAGPLSVTVEPLPEPFTVQAGGGSGTLAPREKRTVTLRFRPTASGTFTADLTIRTNAKAEPTVVRLSGAGR